MASILEKNEAALKRLGEKFWGLYETAKKDWEESKKNTNAESEKREDGCVVENCENGERILCCVRENRKWRLNSIYEPMEAAKMYASRYERIKDFAFLCFFGLSDGRAVREILKKCNDTQLICIYEPDKQVFFQAMKTFPLEDILSHKKLVLIVGDINEEELGIQLFEKITYQNRMLMQCLILPNYDVLYNAQGQNYINQMVYHCKMESFKKNTEIDHAAKLATNILHNLPYILKGNSVLELERVFFEADLTDIPAIIVSAGPSLDKNIKELKKVGNKAFIIAVDSALRALVREGVHFHMAVSVDPRKNPDVFADDRVNQVPYVLAGYSLPLIAERNQNKLFFEGGYGFDAFQKIIKANTDKDIGVLKTGGSVATEALSLALDMRFRNIILVGQDLAFTGGRGHVSGFEKTEEDDKKHVEQSVLTEVEAYGGGVVSTDIQMDSYRQWFEMEIARVKDYVTVYNATEGGARMKGTIEIPLKEVMEQFGKRELPFDQMVADVPPTFTDEEKYRLKDELLQLNHNLSELQQTIEGGIEAYKALLVLEEDGKQGTPEYKELLQVVYQINKIEQESAYMSIIKLYAKSAEYEASEDIYAAEEMSVKEILERGAQLLEGYIGGIAACKEKVSEILEPKLEIV